MSNETKTGTGHSGSPSGVIGTIGSNYVVKNMPCLMPKENMKMFNAMQADCNKQPFNGLKGPFDNFWNGKH